MNYHDFFKILYITLVFGVAEAYTNFLFFPEGFAVRFDI